MKKSIIIGIIAILNLSLLLFGHIETITTISLCITFIYLIVLLGYSIDKDSANEYIEIKELSEHLSSKVSILESMTRKDITVLSDAIEELRNLSTLESGLK